MTPQEYLSQAFLLDRRINSKIEQISTLRELAVKCSAVITGMPHVHGGASPMAEAVDKIVDLEAEINRDMTALVSLKRELSRRIKAVEKPELQTLLELRYLCYHSWEKIAVELGYSLRHVYRMHEEAVKRLQ